MMKKLVIQKLNKELGSDYKNLSKVQELHNRTSLEKINLENKLSPNSNDKGNLVYSSIKTLNEVTNQMKQLFIDYDEVVEKIQKRQSGIAATCSQVEGYLNKIDELEKLLSYFEYLQFIQSASEDLQEAFLAQDDDKLVEIYRSLCNLSGPLSSSGCSLLLQYLKSTVNYWHQLLYEKFKSEYEKLIAAVGWPVVSTNILTSPPSSETIGKFQHFTKLLLLIQIPEKLLDKPIVTSTLLIDFTPLVSPIALLFNPLRKRFLYHFSGNRQTNRPDKPEWMLTQVLTWIRDHETFILQRIQPVFNQICTSRYISVEVELIRGFVKLVVEKLLNNLTQLQYDDELFCHAVDELLAFAQELRDSYNYPSTEPNVLMVLTQPDLFLKWINMERKYAIEKLEMIVSSSTAWSCLSADEDDDLKITECADSFLALLTTITQRYSSLPQPRHKLEFLCLQLDLIDEFLNRLTEITSSFNGEYLNATVISVLNSIHYISDALFDWGTNTHFLLLNHYKLQLEQSDISEASSVFDGKLKKLQIMLDELTMSICQEVMLEVKARSRSYRRDKWFAMPPMKNTAVPTLTASACPMFQVLADKIHFLQRSMASPLFQICWKNVADQLCQFILQELILENTFNQGGAEQLQFDVTRNLIPLFSKFTAKPEQYFSILEEACLILMEGKIPTGIKLTALTKEEAENVLLQKLQ